MSVVQNIIGGRTPHGVRGLKSLGDEAIANYLGVAPLTGCVD